MHKEQRYPDSDEAFRISNSSIQTFLKCGVLYWLEQEAKTRRSTIPMMIGTATSVAAKYDNDAKMRMGLVRLPELVEVAVSTYEKELDSTEYPETYHAAKGAVDDVAGAAKAYGCEISPQILRPEAAEKPLVAEIDPGLELVGTPDCIATSADHSHNLAIRDTKTGQPWSQERADTSRQLSAYSLLAEAHYEEVSARVAIDSIHKKGKTWTTTTFWSYRQESDKAAFVEIARRVRKSIEAGVGLPAPEGAWWCSEKWCRRWAECPVAGGKKGKA